ncbi:MAG: hypothetical protein IKP69_04395 [Oscillospiraceae bacterium]|nr:hypothetical protein [Oscillospiraceae bacterium]
MRVRKIAAALAAVSMLTTIAAQNVFAADTVTVSGEKVKATAGSDFTMAISLSGVPAAGVNAVEFELTYDSAAIAITGAEAGAIVNTGASAKEGFEGVTVFDADYSVDGTVTVTYGVALDDSTYWVTKDGVFLTLNGKVKDGTKDGTYDIKFQAISRETYDGSGKANSDINIGTMSADGTITGYAVKSTNGAVVVGKAEDTTEQKPTDVAPATGKKGDADCNGEVDILDVISINKAIMGKENLTEQGLKNIDFNGNSKPDSSESMSVLKLIVGMITEADL